MVLKKSKKKNSTLFIDASNEFVKVSNRNKLTQKNMDTIIEEYKNRVDTDHFSRLVPNDEIAVQDYNLSVSTYVEQEKELIEHFIDTVNAVANVDEDWRSSVYEQKETDLNQLITEEKLKQEEKKRLMDNSFRDGLLKTTAKILTRSCPLFHVSVVETGLQRSRVSLRS